MRVSNALNAIGEKLKCLSFIPRENLHNIVTFQEVVCRYEMKRWRPLLYSS